MLEDFGLSKEKIDEIMGGAKDKTAELVKEQTPPALRDVETLLKDIDFKDKKALDKVFESLNPLGLDLKYNEDLILSKENENDFGYDLKEFFGIRYNGYRKIGDAIIRIKDHTPNYDNFVEDVDNGAKKIINVVYGDYNNTDAKRLKTDIENFEKQYPDIEVIDIKLKTGDNLKESIHFIKQYVLPEIAKEYQKGTDKKLVNAVNDVLGKKEASAEIAPQKETIDKFLELTNFDQQIENASTTAKKRQIEANRDKWLNENPSMKDIYANSKEIIKQLEDQGIIKEKKGPCF